MVDNLIAKETRLNMITYDLHTFSINLAKGYSAIQCAFCVEKQAICLYGLRYSQGLYTHVLEIYTYITITVWPLWSWISSWWYLIQQYLHRFKKKSTSNNVYGVVDPLESIIAKSHSDVGGGAGRVGQSSQHTAAALTMYNVQTSSLIKQLDNCALNCTG